MYAFENEVPLTIRQLDVPQIILSLEKYRSHNLKLAQPVLFFIFLSVISFR